MTLVWGGPIGDRTDADFNAMAKDAISAARMTGSFSLNVIGVQELGGPDNDTEAVDALIFYPTPQLLLARQLCEKWDSGNFPTYLPHVSIGPAGSATVSTVQNQNPFSDVPAGYVPQGFPMSLRFSKIAACWGDERLIFRLGYSDY